MFLNINFGAPHTPNEAPYDSIEKYSEILDEKRKAPDFILTNQDSIFISNEDMRGKVYVLEFFFTRCPDICIEMNQNMKSLDDKFAESDEFGIISVTIDPKNDTPSVLKKYSEALEIKSQNWHFLTGEKDLSLIHI